MAKPLENSSKFKFFSKKWLTSMISTSSTSKHKSNNTAMNINDFPDSLLLEIILRLPCKSVIQFKSVCKRWLALISEPEFLRRYLRHQHFLQQEPHRHRDWQCSFFVREKTMIIIPEVPSLQLASVYRKFSSSISPNFEVIGSSNGFLLCSKPANFSWHVIYFISNPFSGHTIELPPPPTTTSYFHVRTGFICDPFYKTNPEVTESSVIRNSPRRFWVLRVVQLVESESQCTVEVFSSETRRWNILILPCPSRCFSTGPEYSSVVYNGKLLLEGSNAILAYDPYCNNENGVSHQKLQIQQFRFIDFPADSDRRVFMGCLGLSSAKCLQICQFVFANYTATPNLRVWELTEHSNGGKWRLKHKVYLNEMVKKLSLKNVFERPKLLGFHPYDRDVVYLVFRKQFFSWNLRTKSSTKAGSEGPIRNYLNLSITVELPWWPLMAAS